MALFVLAAKQWRRARRAATWVDRPDRFGAREPVRPASSVPVELIRERERSERQGQRGDRGRRQGGATGEAVAGPVLGPEDGLLREPPWADEPADVPSERRERNEDETERRQHQGPPFASACAGAPTARCVDAELK